MQYTIVNTKDTKISKVFAFMHYGREDMGKKVVGIKCHDRIIHKAM